MIILAIIIATNIRADDPPDWGMPLRGMARIRPLQYLGQYSTRKGSVPWVRCASILGNIWKRSVRTQATPATGCATAA